jgi:putative radical SAM enzyme (TIGR03279 family)
VSAPRVVAVSPGSPAARAGIVEGDEIAAVNGTVPRDLIEWRVLVDEPELVLEVGRGGLDTVVEIAKRAGEPLGVEVHSALFDRVRTCDNHCEFCFIYQLPPGLRRSLYLKDDDYRLSFLYGNFTTLTRFTEADLERVVTEGLGPLYVSIHATDPDVRAEMLRNRRGATSLRWLRALLDHGVEVHGQVVACPGVNDGAVLDDTLAGVLDRYPELASVCVVPLGVSRYSTEARMRPHTRAEAAAVVDAVGVWQQLYLAVLGRRLVYAADEYYLLADRPFPPAGDYGQFPMHEDGIGMARAFEIELLGGRLPGAGRTDPTGERGGFFRTTDASRPPAAGPAPVPACGATPVQASPTPPPRAQGRQNGVGHGTAHAPGSGAGDGGTADVSRSVDADYEPYRGARQAPAARPLHIGPSRGAPVALLTAPYGARVLAPLVERLGRPDVRIVTVDNEFFGGNVGVSGLMVGSDLARVLADQPEGHRYLLPDVCLTQGRFLDGTEPADLPRPVEVVPADGASLRAALGLAAGAGPSAASGPQSPDGRVPVGIGAGGRP